MQEIESEVKGHEELMSELDRTGTHLKYFSQKQDVILVKNLLSGVQHRWDKLLLRLAERGNSNINHNSHFNPNFNPKLVAWRS